MAEYNHIAYIEDIARRLKVIGHSDSEKRFYRIASLRDLQELISNLMQARMPALGVLEFADGRLVENQADKVDVLESYSFLVLHRAHTGDHDARNQVKEQMKAIMLEVFSKYKKDRATDYSLDTEYGLRHLDLNSFSWRMYDTLPDNLMALVVNFTCSNFASLKINDSDWEPGSVV
jgi:hypothetical protein